MSREQQKYHMSLSVLPVSIDRQQYARLPPNIPEQKLLTIQGSRMGMRYKKRLRRKGGGGGGAVPWWKLTNTWYEESPQSWKRKNINSPLPRYTSLSVLSSEGSTPPPKNLHCLSSNDKARNTFYLLNIISIDAAFPRISMRHQFFPPKLTIPMHLALV